MKIPISKIVPVWKSPDMPSGGQGGQQQQQKKVHGLDLNPPSDQGSKRSKNSSSQQQQQQGQQGQQQQGQQGQQQQGQQGQGQQGQGQQGQQQQGQQGQGQKGQQQQQQGQRGKDIGDKSGEEGNGEEGNGEEGNGEEGNGEEGKSVNQTGENVSDKGTGTKASKLSSLNKAGNLETANHTDANKISSELSKIAGKAGLGDDEAQQSKMRDVIKKVVDKGKSIAKEHGMPDPWGGAGTDNMREYVSGLHKVQNWKEVLNKIRGRINKYKILFGDVTEPIEAYQHQPFVPQAAAYGKFKIPVELSRWQQNTFDVPILLIAIDTSGSVGPAGLKIAVNVINQTANYFKSINELARVFKIDFDDAVQLPITPWKPISDTQMRTKKIDVQGRGGTGFNSLLAGLDDIFTYTKGKTTYFVYNPDSLAFRIRGSIAIDSNHTNKHAWNIKGQKIVNNKIVIDGEEYEMEKAGLLSDLPQTRPLIIPLNNNRDPKVKKKVPFLITITDGGFNAKADLTRSKLYKNAKDNILYVLTEPYKEMLDPNDAAHVVELYSYGKQKTEENKINDFLEKMFEDFYS